MKRVLGILALLVTVYLATWLMSDILNSRHSFMTGYNHENLIRRTALYGIISIGVAFVIITGGIDLSIGSVICLIGVGLPWVLLKWKYSLPGALALVVVVSLGIGLWHGFLVTKLRLQPFVVTLCGLLIYRGITRGLTRDQSAGFENEFQDLRWLSNGKVPIPFVEGFGIPVPGVILAIVAVLAIVFLNKTIYGRYLLALGNNEEAAKFSGINTDRMIILAYVICSALAGLGGVLFILDSNSGQPVDFGNFYELFAIAAAVLGGCSLRGGQGTIIGVIIGAALMQVLSNMIILVDWIQPHIKYAIIGAVILAGVTADELAKRAVAKRRVAQEG